MAVTKWPGPWPGGDTVIGILNDGNGTEYEDVLLPPPGGARMFDPTGKAKITMTGDDGTTYEIDGYVTNMNLTADRGVAYGAEVSFVGTGPPVVPDVVSLPGTITDLDMRGGTLDYTPDVSIDTECPVATYRPWDTEWCMIASMIPVALVTWAVLKFVL